MFLQSVLHDFLSLTDAVHDFPSLFAQHASLALPVQDFTFSVSQQAFLQSVLHAFLSFADAVHAFPSLFAQHASLELPVHDFPSVAVYILSANPFTKETKEALFVLESSYFITAVLSLKITLASKTPSSFDNLDCIYFAQPISQVIPEILSANSLVFTVVAISFLTSFLTSLFLQPINYKMEILLNLYTVLIFSFSF